MNKICDMTDEELRNLVVQANNELQIRSHKKREQLATKLNDIIKEINNEGYDIYDGDNGLILGVKFDCGDFYLQYS